MALTVIQRETFQGVGELTSGSPGNLGAVTGTFHKRAVGPKVTGDATASGLGWSADLRQITEATIVRHNFTVPASGAQSIGCLSGFYYINSFANNGSAKQYLLSAVLGNTNQLIYSIIDSTTGNFWYNRNGLWTDTNSGVAVPLKQWFEMRLAWQNTSGNSYKVHLMYRLAGGSTWTTIYLMDTAFNAGDVIATARGGAPNLSNSSGSFRGRYGMAALCSFAAWSERTDLQTDVVDPPAGPYSWYVNASTGSDSNEGVTFGSAWQTIDKLNAESLHCGMFPATVSGCGLGDTLNIDNTSASLDLTNKSLAIKTAGLKVNSDGWIKADRTVTGWTKTGGRTNIYETTDGSSTDLTGVVLWEDDKWMTHPTGANFAAVAATLDATPGSFFSDGTKVYVHPFASTDPTSDGKAYTRSRYRGSVGESAVVVQAADVWLDGIQIKKTCLARLTDNDPYIAECVQWDLGSSGTCRLSNSELTYWSKHAAARTVNSSNMRVERINVTYGPGTPYVGFGGQTVEVDYADSGTGSTFLYENCTCTANVGVIGGTGTASTSQPFWLSHGTARHFASGEFRGCVLCSSLNEQGTLDGDLTVTDTTLTGAAVNCDIVFERCKFTETPPQNDWVSGSVTLTDCILVITSINAGLELPTEGVLSLTNCTIDLRSATSNSNDLSIWKRGGVLAFTMTDSAFLGSATKRFAVLRDALSAETVVFQRNAYQLGASTAVVHNYNDGATTADRTFAQWQALGKDAGSSSVADVIIDGDYFPQVGSPLLTGGLDRGRESDYSGNIFLHRSAIGALELETNPADSDDLVWSATWASREVTQYERYYDTATEEWVEAVTVFTGTTPNPPVAGRAYAEIRVVAGDKPLEFFQ